MEIRRDRYLERLIAHKGNGRVKIVTAVSSGASPPFSGNTVPLSGRKAGYMNS